MNSSVIRLSRTLLRAFIVVLAVSALTFLIMDALPGDAAYEIAGMEATLEDVETLREQLGLNEPVLIRYAQWLAKVSGGDLGYSLQTRESVLQAILSRLPVTIELMIVSQLLALMFAIPLGIICAYKPGSTVDNSVNSLGFAMMSVPIFVTGIVLIYIFSIKLKWLPATGYTPLAESIMANIKSFILPASSIAMIEWVPLMRVLRNDMSATLQEDFILMAKAKGLPTSHILLKHALRPSSFTLITIFGIQIGHLIGGALIIELIFALPGVGRLLIGAIYGRDYAMVQGCILFITIAYVSLNFIVDMLYAVLDPRIREEIPPT